MTNSSENGRWSRREVALGLLAAPFVLSTVARAQSSAKYEFGVAGIDPIYSAPYVAFKKGYFKEAGVDVGYLNSQSGPRTKQILTAGQVLIGSSGVNDALATTVAGKPTTVVFGLDRRITYANILIRKEDAAKYKSVKDLSGQRLAVTQLQSATWLMAVFIAEKGGAKDVDIRGLGDFATMLGALKSKQVAATIATSAMLEQMKGEDWAVPLFSIGDDSSWKSTFGGDVPGIGCYVLQEQIEKNPAAIQAVVSGLVKAQDLINASTPEQLTELLHEDYMSSLPKATVTSGLTFYKQNVFSKDNIITEENYANLADIIKDRQFTPEQMAKIPYKQAINMDFVRKARTA
ncbi:NitT/TauT family transport system substrate-binding protein [Tardiphaga robiniae]|jgi:NitT/TauT family transport system substrate-binding protein|uniref:ABC transporter substrate-binding protein n=1 Tax=Tardiphaga robiniae TaxID=943830 RepID=UPI0028640793|nr:ABC transporter substrate-binding protein [Tardiphaga robiniae]MDR6659386.1 NitT/TauT family transport system substrate-binding protein [Tardiphaga robiniae]